MRSEYDLCHLNDDTWWPDYKISPHNFVFPNRIPQRTITGRYYMLKTWNHDGHYDSIDIKYLTVPLIIFWYIGFIRVSDIYIYTT